MKTFMENHNNRTETKKITKVIIFESFPGKLQLASHQS